MPTLLDARILNGKYHILGHIAEGGMAHVWLAAELTLNARKVTLKEPKTDLVFPALAVEVQRRFSQELRICDVLNQAKAPNIVRAYTADPFEDTVLLAMEYMAGGDLASRLQQRPILPQQEAIDICLQVLEALQAVHAHPLEIVHRDIKPSNILFDGDGVAHLADFGLAQVAGFSVDRSLFLGDPHPGTWPYMSPEQRANDGGYLTGASDLYSMGCILFEMLSGNRYEQPFHKNGSVQNTGLRAKFPDWLQEVLDLALAERPEERYQDAGEMIEALQQPTMHKSRTASADGSPDIHEPPAHETPTPQMVPINTSSGSADVSTMPGVASAQKTPVSGRKWGWQKPAIRFEQESPDPPLLSPFQLVAGIVILAIVLFISLYSMGMIVNP